MNASEADRAVSSLRTFSLPEVGTAAYLAQHHFLEQLNIASHHTIAAHSDEFVLESFLLHDKIPVLIHDLLLIETWLDQIKPRLEPEITAFADKSVKPYLLSFHPSILLNLLESMMFHTSAVEATGIYAPELAEYCLRHLKEHNFACLSILRFLAENIKLFSGLPNIFTNKFDLPSILIALLDEAPWLKKNAQGKWTKFENGEYKECKDPADRFILTIPHAHVWLTLLALLTSPEFRGTYEVTPQRKDDLLRLKKYFNEVLLDQLPVLVDVQRAIEEISLLDTNVYANTSFAKKPFVIEEISEIRTRMLACDFASIAKEVRTWFFSLDDEREHVARMAALYGSAEFERAVMTPECAVCKRPATSRCSKCKRVWYCGRECQVADWKSHKPECHAEPKVVVQQE
jgi:hypothetical protein